MSVISYKNNTIFYLVTRMGFEPMDVALRGLCVNRFTNEPLAAPVRFELTLTESESDALPLGYGAKYKSILSYFYYYDTINLFFLHYFFSSSFSIIQMVLLEKSRF